MSDVAMLQLRPINLDFATILEAKVMIFKLCDVINGNLLKLYLIHIVYYLWCIVVELCCLVYVRDCSLIICPLTWLGFRFLIRFLSKHLL